MEGRHRGIIICDASLQHQHIYIVTEAVALSKSNLWVTAVAVSEIRNKRIKKSVLLQVSLSGIYDLAKGNMDSSSKVWYVLQVW